MLFGTLSFRVNYLAMFLKLFCFPVMFPLSGASIILQSSDNKLTESTNLNDGASLLENTMLPITTDVQFRLDAMENIINQIRQQNANQQNEILQLKNEMKNHKEEIQQIKSAVHHLVVDLNYNVSNNHQEKSKRDDEQMPIETSTTITKLQPGIVGKVKRQAVDGKDSSASWVKLEISDRVIGYMDYDTYTIKVYDHASNKEIQAKNEEKKYYFEPIGQLNHLSAQSSFNNISRKPEMTFNVNMWSDTVRNAVHRFISDDLKLGPVNINLVRVLPLDRVMMYSEVGSQNVEIEQNWIDYKSDKFLKFKYICDKMKHCNDMALQMKTNPEQFKLKMRFSLSSQKSQAKETTISVENILEGEMMNQMDQQFKGKECVLITAEGKKQLLKESSENVIIQTIDDSEVLNKNSQADIYRKLESMIQFGRSTIQKGDEKAWESNVFWNHDNYRPDVSTRIVKGIYRKLDSESQKKMASAYSKTNNVGFEGGFSLMGLFSGNSQLSADFSREGFENKESVEKFLNESKDRVEWDGVKFVPKQMELYAINMARLRNTQTFKDTSIRVSYTSAILTIDVRHDFSEDPKTSSQFMELKTQIEDLAHVKRKGHSSRTPPSSCHELSEIGHYLNGIYVVTNKTTKKVQIVFCQFKSSVSQETIGNLDIKTKSVHFYLQRNTSFGSTNAVIPFELARLNEGGAMVLESGVFTAPIPGIYHFEFSGQRNPALSYLSIYLQLNGVNIGMAHTHSTTGVYDTVALSASLRLKANDTVNLYNLNSGILHDDSTYHFTHFTGWLVEQDLI